MFPAYRGMALEEIYSESLDYFGSYTDQGAINYIFLCQAL